MAEAGVLTMALSRVWGMHRMAFFRFPERWIEEMDLVECFSCRRLYRKLLEKVSLFLSLSVDLLRVRFLCLHVLLIVNEKFT